MNKASFFGSLVVVLACSISACGDDTDPGNTGGAASSSSNAANVTSTGSGTASGTSSTQAAASTGSGENLSVILPTIGVASFFIDCSPVVADDPISGSVSVTYENGNDSPQTFTVDGTTLHLGKGADTLDWAFDVDPATSGAIPAQQSVTVEHAKLADSGVGTPLGALPCSFCGGSWSLDVSYSASGTTLGGHGIASVGLGTIDCAQ